MTEYHLTTLWQIEAAPQAVFPAIADFRNRCAWWPGMADVEELTCRQGNGADNVRRYRWHSGTLCELRFDARTTRVEAPTRLEATISGDLEGTGQWSLHAVDGTTWVRHEWHVRPTRRRMHLLAPIAFPWFAVHHQTLMMEGARGVSQLLDAPLKGATTQHRGAGATGLRILRAVCSLGPGAAGALSGIMGGIVATIVQVALWRLTSQPVWEALLRDSRLAAAILLGRSALAPATGFVWRIMLAASLIHFGLSIAYGCIQAPLSRRLRPTASVLAGALSGWLLYLVNMYGFTAVFPWFVLSRGWITAIAHVAFGIAAAIAYKWWQYLKQAQKEADAT